MDMTALRAFFMWCTIFNAALLSLAFLICALAGNFVYRMHSRWFPISRDAFNVAIYSLLGFYKTLVVAFCFVPWMALLVVK